MSASKRKSPRGGRGGKRMCEGSTSTAPAKLSASKVLAAEYKRFQEEPVEGFKVKLGDENNLFVWDVALFGPPHTLYEGGYFKAKMTFPFEYPYKPPKLRFVSSVWHPNVYKNGEICISILHEPGDDPRSGEQPCERWNPTQTIRTILLSIISLLNEPNTMSPANVDASVMYRKWKDSNGTEKEYEDIVKKQVEETRAEALKDGVKVPVTLEEYTRDTRTKKEEPAPFDFSEFYYQEDNDSNEEDRESSKTESSKTSDE